MDALKRNAPDEEVERLRAEVTRLHAGSEAALEDFQRQVAVFKRSRPTTHS